MNYTGSFSLNSLGLGQSGLMQAYQTGMTAQSDATGYKPFAYNPDSGKVRRPRQGDPAVDSFQRYLEASMANNLPSYPLSNPFNHAAHYRNVVYTAVSSMMRVLSSASIRLEIKRDGSGGMASVAGDSRDHDYIPFNDHYLSDFLRSPNPADDFASFLGKCILQYHLTGRLLIWGVPNKWGLPVRFYVLPTALCIPNPGVPTDRYPMGAWRVQNYYPSSGMVGILPGPAAGIASTPGALIDAREIYVMNNPHPLFNWASLSGLDAMSVQTDVVEMMDKAFWSVYRQGPRIAGILTAPGATADQIDDLNSAINSTYAGPDNAGKIWTTGGRVDAPSFTPISLGPEQLDITARATYEAQIIAAVTGQDRTVLGLKTDGVGSYSERWAAMADVRERTYIPWLGMLASMLTRGPVRDWGLEDKGVRVAIRLPRLNDPVMVQADTNAGAADGTMTTDEVRARRDMGPDPLGLGHLPPAIRTMTLQLAAEQGGLPPNPTPPGDDGSEETVDINDPSDDGTALGALRASREEPDGEPIAPTAAVEQAQARQSARTKPPRKPAGAGTKSKAGKGKPEKKAMPELAAYQTPLHEFVKQPLVRTVGEDFPEELYHGTIKKSAKAFQTGTDLPEHQRSKTLSEFGPDVVYASEATAPHQALMFGSGTSKAGARVMTALRLRKGAKVLDLTPYMTRRPAMWSADTEVLHVAHRPSFTADLQEWLQGRRVARGVGAMPADRLAGYTDPHADTFHAPSYAELLPKYAKDRGYAAMRFADETIITDRSAIIGARVAKPHEVDALRETADAGKAARTKHSLFADAVNPRVKEDAHRQAVEAALRRGDHVPAYVLADYPDLHGEAKALPENPEHHTEAVHALHRILQADPLNHGLRQVYADALDDAGAHHEAVVHRMIAAGTPEHPHPDWYAKSTDTELGRVASHVAHELTAVTRDVGWGIYSPHESSTDANAHAQNNEHDMAYNEHSSAMFRHRRERTHPYPGGDAQTEEDLTRHDIAARAHDVARLIHGQLDRGSRTVKSDLAMSAFDAGTGGTLVPAAGSATVPAKKKRRVLSSRESHAVIERAVAEVLGTAVVEAKAELADPPSDPDPQKVALRAMEPRAKKGFHAHMADLYRGEEPLMHEHLADEDSRLDHFHDYLSDEHQIRVRPDGLVTFHAATGPVKRIIGDLPVMLYHHTSDAIDSKVQQEGLKVRRGKVASPHLNSSAGVYITTEYSGPAVSGYLENARQFHGGNYRTWGVKTHLHELTPDPDDADISSGRYQYVVPHVHPNDLIDLDHGVKAFADPDPTPAFDRYAAHRKYLAELPVVHAQPLGNPIDHSNVSHVLTLQHPRRQIKAVFKPSEGEQPGLRLHIPMHAGAQAARESAASHVAEIAGYHDLVPATTLRHHEGQHGSVQRFVADGILAAKLEHEERFGSNHDDVRRAAAFDYLIGNTDRHLGNWLVRPTPHGDKIALIDHGLAFPEKHPDGREAYNFEIMRHAMYHKPTRGEPAPNPGGSDPDGKWLAIRRTLTEHGLSSNAIADTGKRWRVLTSGRFHFGELLSEHPDDLIGKLNDTHATTPTRSGV